MSLVSSPLSTNHAHNWAQADQKKLLRQLFEAAVAAADPLVCLAPYLPPPPQNSGRIVVIGAGKAAASMAYASDIFYRQNFAHASISGVVVTRDGHSMPQELFADTAARILVLEAAHPVPDARCVGASQKILSSVANLTANDLVLCLISGGGSSLITLPHPVLDLATKQNITRKLLKSGANIHEMNCVRKHLSSIKGGRLAAACHPAQVLTLAISDVPGDVPEIIASGPSIADTSTCADALHVLQHYDIDVPLAVVHALSNGELESIKPDDMRLAGHRYALIASPQKSLEAAAQQALALGITPIVLGDALEGESFHAGLHQAGMALALSMGRLQLQGQPIQKPCVLLSGGETTVTISENTPAGGRGGRAAEFCLGLATGLNGAKSIWALAADTDGIDGTEDNAGAFVMPDTLERSQSLAAELHVKNCTVRHDGYGFFDALGDLFTTGPTHTNVNDFRAVLVA